ncbi:MAG: hypothetical protein J07HQW2_03125 [Haloquadratum walsbyi J07HQW2]|uniref:Uncharacterized protein n=1 Tax=Haloquadratum walsbyi J07HQW2 TaxID=1238425 RepID=U1NIB0_9EURY|nr:MAG: hypothetical protein J07HQW2_03125 [Haloquadratum walsbyi J07HQW2]
MTRGKGRAGIEPTHRHLLISGTHDIDPHETLNDKIVSVINIMPDCTEFDLFQYITHLSGYEMQHTT